MVEPKFFSLPAVVEYFHVNKIGSIVVEYVVVIEPVDYYGIGRLDTCDKGQ